MQGVIFIGLQASGKSTYYLQNFYKTHLRLNRDMLKTQHRETVLFNACLQSKQAVVIDNTNPTKDDRAGYIDSFKNSKFEIVAYYFRSNLKECLSRNAARIGKEKVPDIGLKGTYNKLEIPSYNEGFDKLYYVNLNNGEFTLDEWKNEI